MGKFGEAVDHNEDGIMALNRWKVGDPVEGNVRPGTRRDGEGLERDSGSLTGGFIAMADITCIHVGSNKSVEVGDVEVSGEGMRSGTGAAMSC